MAAGASPVGVTFHMAFDALDEAAQDESVGVLAGLGVDRILIHGGPAGSPIERNIPRLRELVSLAEEGISILPGGGVTWENAEAVAAATGVREVHGTRVVRL